MVNPTKLLKLKSAWEKFTINHPKFPNFLRAVRKNGLEEGTIIEIIVTPKTGNPISTNIKVAESDMELFNDLTEMFGK